MRPHTGLGRSAPGPGGEAGFGALVRGNANFRRLWLGGLVSLLGDWFNTIAIYSLVTELTGSPFALGAVFIFKMLPAALASPLAGVLVDRLDRRRLMIGADLVRAVVVLGFLLVDEPGEVAFLYALTALQVVVGAVFQPAQSASLPNLTTPRELLTANALMSATWSVMLAVGAALGGFATEWLGTEGVFVVDSLSYVVSAAFLYRTTIPQSTEAPPQGALLRQAVDPILDGWRHLRAHPRVARIALAKAAWAVAGGALVFMLTLLGEAVSPAAHAVGIGLLFAVRGVGTGVGPLVVRAAFRDRRRWPALLGTCVAASGACYATVGFLPWTYVVAVFVLLAHAFSGANWTLSSVLLQERTEDRFRGRVFATEWFVLMLVDTVSILAASLLLESNAFDLRTAFRAFGALQVAIGLAWLLFLVPRERREAG